MKKIIIALIAIAFASCNKGSNYCTKCTDIKAVPDTIFDRSKVEQCGLTKTEARERVDMYKRGRGYYNPVNKNMFTVYADCKIK